MPHGITQCYPPPGRGDIPDAVRIVCGMVRYGVCPSVCPVDRPLHAAAVRRVCCPGSRSSARRRTAVRRSAANASSVALSADVGGWMQNRCNCLLVCLFYSSGKLNSQFHKHDLKTAWIIRPQHRAVPLTWCSQNVTQHSEYKIIFFLNLRRRCYWVELFSRCEVNGA